MTRRLSLMRSARAAAPLALLGLLLALTGACQEAAPAPEPKPMPARPHVFVILVDTLRADALGFTGYERDVSPRLDRWAERAVIFEDATTPAGWTRPAVVSMFTGLYPATHGTQDKDHVAPESLEMLAEVFRDAGYDTSAFVTNFAVDEQFGVMQGFERYRWFDKEKDSSPGTPAQLNYVPVGDIDAEVREFLRGPHERPVFGYIHTTDPHFPYMPPPEYLKWGTAPRDRYDGEVRYTDEIVGGWLDLLEETGLLDESIVVLTADHGEEFGEHGGQGHGITVFQECVRVPLVVWAPPLVPGRRAEQVSLADLGPTLLEAAQVIKPQGFAPQGRSFWGLATGTAPATGWSWAYHELVYPSKGITFAYREGSEKFVHVVRDVIGRRQWTGRFDVVKDPFEQQDLTPADPERSRALRAQMQGVREQHVAAAVEAQREPLEDEALEKMRALGYVD